jgi:hypothetical protein
MALEVSRFVTDGKIRLRISTPTWGLGLLAAIRLTGETTMARILRITAIGRFPRLRGAIKARIESLKSTDNDFVFPNG